MLFCGTVSELPLNKKGEIQMSPQDETPASAPDTGAVDQPVVNPTPPAGDDQPQVPSPAPDPGLPTPAPEPPTPLTPDPSGAPAEPESDSAAPADPGANAL